MKKGRNNWATPQALFDVLHAEFRFDFDVCAEAHNAKCERYFDIEKNGLAMRWAPYMFFMNPPYKDQYGKNCVHLWTRRALDQAMEGGVGVGLLKLDPTTNWWRDYVMEAAEIRILTGPRLKFDDGKGSAEFPCAVVVWRRHVNDVHSFYWDWRKDLAWRKAA